MPTDFSYTFSDRANQEIDAKLVYIEKHWNKKTADRFWIDLIKRIDLITRNPTAFRKSDKYHGVRRSVLSKKTIIYYEVNFQKHLIEILSVFDTNQDPNSFSPNE